MDSDTQRHSATNYEFDLLWLTFLPSLNQTPSQSSLLSLHVNSAVSLMIALTSDKPQMKWTPGSNTTQQWTIILTFILNQTCFTMIGFHFSAPSCDSAMTSFRLLTNHHVFYQWAFSFTPFTFPRASCIFSLVTLIVVFRTCTFTLFLKKMF